MLMNDISEKFRKIFGKYLSVHQCCQLKASNLKYEIHNGVFKTFRKKKNVIQYVKK